MHDNAVIMASTIHSTWRRDDINRNFAWSGPVAAFAAVGVARAAYEDALAPMTWWRSYARMKNGVIHRSVKERPEMRPPTFPNSPTGKDLGPKAKLLSPTHLCMPANVAQQRTP
jgi:hypothetical protein